MMEIGSQIIYRKPKYSPNPGPRAETISPSQHGDSYSYVVDKFWVVVAEPADEKVVVMTRRGKKRTLSIHDPNIRIASLFQRLRYRHRFPTPQQVQEFRQKFDEAE